MMVDDAAREEFRQLGERLRGLREACDLEVDELASALDVTPEVYREWEETGADVPISAIHHLAHRAGVDFAEIVTGKTAKLDSIQVVRAGTGRTIDRDQGYHYQDLAWRFNRKIMQPLLVTLDPSDKPAELVSHRGQEFNLVTQGTLLLRFDDKEIFLETGDCVYFDPSHPHGQKCASKTPVVFVTIVAE